MKNFKVFFNAIMQCMKALHVFTNTAIVRKRSLLFKKN